MKRTNLLLLIFFAAAVSLHAQSKPTLAILPITGGNVHDGETIAELFSFQPEIQQMFTPVPRGSLDAIMKEQQFQRSTGLTDADTIARLGKQYNAQYVLAGHIQVLGGSNLIILTIIHVESLQQIAGDYRPFKNSAEISNFLPVMARRIAAASRINRANLPRLAVFPFDVTAGGVNQGEAEALAQMLATEIANSGKYAVLPRMSQLETVMKEQRIQRAGITDPGSIKALGQALNARYVLAGRVRSNIFTAQVLDVESGGQAAGGYENYTSITEGLTKMAALAGKLTASGGSTNAFVRVEGGTFQRENQTVRVSGFSMGRYPVTQKEWTALMGSNPSNFKGDNRPVECVSWYDAVEYCNRLSEKEGLTPAYTINKNRRDWNSRSDRDNVQWTVTLNRNASGYRLPTEAEWEYAARGGNGSPGNYEYSGSNNVDEVAWYNENSGGSTQEVGTKKPNSLGLYDISGNVWEWCWDWYGDYVSGSQTDPLGAASGVGRVLRGGSWIHYGQFARSACRDVIDNPSNRSYMIGFRLVRP